MLAPSSSKYNTLDDLATYERVWNPNIKRGIDLNEDTPCMGVVNYVIELHELLQRPFTVKVGSDVDFEMKSKTDTIMKLAVVCCGDKKLIDEYIAKFGNPIK